MMNLTAKEIMSNNILWVKTTMTLEDLAMLLCEHSITGAPVMDEMGQIVGVVSRSDIVNYTNAISQHEKDRTDEYYHVHRWGAKLGNEELEQLHAIDEGEVTVKDIMTPTVFSVDEHATLLNIIDQMMENKVHRLFATHGKDIVGIITTGDLLRVIAERLRV